MPWKIVIVFLAVLHSNYNATAQQADKRLTENVAKAADTYHKKYSLDNTQRDKIYKFLLNREQINNSGKAPKTQTTEELWHKQTETDSFLKIVFTKQQYLRYENAHRIDAIDKE